MCQSDRVVIKWLSWDEDVNAHTHTRTQQFIYCTFIEKNSTIHYRQLKVWLLCILWLLFSRHQCCEPWTAQWESDGLMQSHYGEWDKLSDGSALIRLSEDASLLLSPCDRAPPSPRLPLCATQDSEASPLSSSWKCSFFPPCLMMSLHFCPLLWRMEILYYGCRKGCGEDKERLRCHALEAAEGVPVMRWLCFLWR